jgi:hypothetical protein
MKKDQKAEMYKQIEKHGNDLNAIFHTDLQPVDLCKKLFRIENHLHAWLEYYCNGEHGVDSEKIEKHINRALNQLDKILEYRAKGIPVFINSDPRGYALKIDNKYMRKNNIDLYQDWGGCGVIAPDFSPE